MLPDVIDGLTAARAWQAGQIVVHTSARHGIGILDGAMSRYVLPLALHPAMRFGGTPVDLERLLEASIAVTTTDELRPVGEALVIEMGAEPIVIAESDRPAYAEAIPHLRLAAAFPSTLSRWSMIPPASTTLPRSGWTRP